MERGENHKNHYLNYSVILITIEVPILSLCTFALKFAEDVAPACVQERCLQITVSKGSICGSTRHINGDQRRVRRTKKYLICSNIVPMRLYNIDQYTHAAYVALSGFHIYRQAQVWARVCGYRVAGLGGRRPPLVLRDRSLQSSEEGWK